MDAAERGTLWGAAVEFHSLPRPVGVRERQGLGHKEGIYLKTFALFYYRMAYIVLFLKIIQYKYSQFCNTHL